MFSKLLWKYRFIKAILGLRYEVTTPEAIERLIWICDHLPIRFAERAALELVKTRSLSADQVFSSKTLGILWRTGRHPWVNILDLTHSSRHLVPVLVYQSPKVAYHRPGMDAGVSMRGMVVDAVMHHLHDTGNELTLPRGVGRPCSATVHRSIITSDYPKQQYGGDERLAKKLWIKAHLIEGISLAHLYYDSIVEYGNARETIAADKWAYNFFDMIDEAVDEVLGFYCKLSDDALDPSSCQGLAGCETLVCTSFTNLVTWFNVRHDEFYTMIPLLLDELERRYHDSVGEPRLQKIRHAVLVEMNCQRNNAESQPRIESKIIPFPAAAQ